MNNYISTEEKVRRGLSEAGVMLEDYRRVIPELVRLLRSSRSLAITKTVKQVAFDLGVSERDAMRRVLEEPQLLVQDQADAPAPRPARASYVHEPFKYAPRPVTAPAPAQTRGPVMTMEEPAARSRPAPPRLTADTLIEELSGYLRAHYKQAGQVFVPPARRLGPFKMTEIRETLKNGTLEGLDRIIPHGMECRNLFLETFAMAAQLVEYNKGELFVVVPVPARARIPG